MKITRLFKDFFESEKAGGFVLIACTIISLVLANSYFGESYRHFWHIPIGARPIEFWINDGLMTVFFLLIGLEMEREVYIGELANIRNALLPVSAAIGGMIIPDNWKNGLLSSNSLGIAAGLVLGKPVGIVVFSLLAVAIGLCSFPEGLRKKNLIGVGFLAGIGFTMSIFITLLAFEEPGIITDSKNAVLAASLVAGLAGFMVLKMTLPDIIEEEVVLEPIEV